MTNNETGRLLDRIKRVLLDGAAREDNDGLDDDAEFAAAQIAGELVANYLIVELPDDDGAGMLTPTGSYRANGKDVS